MEESETNILHVAYNRTRYQILIPVANQIVEDAKVMLAREEEVLRQTQILPTPRSPQPPALLPLAPSLLQLPLRDPGVEMENENEEVDVLR